MADALEYHKAVKGLRAPLHRRIMCFFGLHEPDYQINGFMRDPKAVECCCVWCDKELKVK